MARSTTRRTGRVVLLTICGLAIIALMGTIVHQSYVTNSTASTLVEGEEEGATSLHPMLALVGALVGMQSAAVRNDSTVDAAVSLNTAMNQVAGVDPTYGSRPKNIEAVNDLNNQIRMVMARKPTGRPAYDAYSGLTTLAVNMMRNTADTSHLIHDPEVDSYFVMDAAVTRLPDALVYAGRAADLVALGGGHSLTGTDAVSAAVARFFVSNSAAQVSAGLRQSVDFTSNSALGGNFAARLDAFMAAAAAFAPPNMLTQLSGTVSDPAALAADARTVYSTALSLAHYLITQLQNLLSIRESGLVGDWRFTATAAGAAGLVALLMIWLLAIARPQGNHARGMTGSEPGSDRADDLPVSPLTDAQQLFDQEELVHVGRSVRPRARGRGDAF